MARLIDAEALVKALLERSFYPTAVRRAIEKAPTIDAEPVRHGRWVIKEDLLMDTYYDCSACGESFYLLEGAPDENYYNYCPNCGAKMDGE